MSSPPPTHTGTGTSADQQTSTQDSPPTREEFNHLKSLILEIRDGLVPRHPGTLGASGPLPTQVLTGTDRDLPETALPGQKSIQPGTPTGLRIADQPGTLAELHCSDQPDSQAELSDRPTTMSG
ncbi:hypothetical protein Dimus_038777 [Dionaea muscipula]